MHGLRVSSDLEIPGAVRDADAAPASVVIRCGLVPPAPSAPSLAGACWQAAPNWLALRVPGVAAYDVRDGCQITVQPAAGACADDVRVFLAGSVMAALLHQRGVLALHACAVIAGRGGLLFAGHSGVGKSTLAHALTLRGHHVLTDEVAAVTEGDAGPIIQPCGSRIGLWADAAARAGLRVSELRRVRPGIEKFSIGVERFVEQSAPLETLYLLESGAAPGYRVEFLTGAGALRAVCRHVHSPAFLRASATGGAWLARAARIVASVAVARVSYDRQPETLCRLIETVEARKAS
jgi:hypothetical protein